MAETVHLFLKANGTDIEGESTQVSLGRENSIECISYEHAVTSTREAGTSMATGRRHFTPIKIMKRIDKATPLLMKALSHNEIIEGQFKFFRPNPVGDGTTEQYFTVEIAQGNIAAIKHFVPDTTNADTANLPPLEQVEITFRSITWTYTNGGVMHEDTWASSR